MQFNNDKALVIFSGGQDSTVCLCWALRNFKEVHAVSFDYGQRHAHAELKAAQFIINMLTEHTERNISYELVMLGHILRGSSPLVNGAEVLEQYKDMHSLPDGLEKTFVPGRNLLMLTVAANVAYSFGITNLVTGVCQADNEGYPDCRQNFIDAAEHTLRLGLSANYADPFQGMRIHTPLMDLSKADTCRMAYAYPECWEAMAYTHTSYDGAYPPVGKDHATLLRAKGFLEAGLPDPLILRAWREGRMALPDTDNYATFTIK